MSTTAKVEATGHILTTRSSIVSGVRNADDRENWERFDRYYQGFIRGMARRQGLNEHEADEVVQNVLLSVLKSVKSYDRAKGSFTAWLAAVVRRRIVDQYRSRRRLDTHMDPLPDSGEEMLILHEIEDPSSPNPNAVAESQWAQWVEDRAYEMLKAEVDEHDYAVFDLRHRRGKDVAETAKLLDVTKLRVSWVTHSLKRKLDVAIRRVLKKEGLTIPKVA